MHEATTGHKAWNHPSEDPRNAKRRKIAAERRKKMTFESPAEQADYERLVTSNPKNDGLYGYPRQMLFPPAKLPVLAGIKRECSDLGHRWSNTIDKWCIDCGIDKPVEQKGETHVGV